MVPETARKSPPESAVPSRVPFEHGFVPRAWLRNGHLQTLGGALLPRRHILPAPEARLVAVAEDTRVLCHCHWQSERSRALTLVTVHGLEGSSSSQYMIGTANKAWAAGMNVVRMNMRNCGGTENLTPTLYNSSMSSDVAAVVHNLIADEKLSRVAVAGFSMGGNLVMKCAGEWGREAPPQVEAVCAISPAMDLAASADALHLPANRPYEWAFLLGLHERLARKARLFPSLYRSYPLLSIGSLREFDDRITAPHGGFTGAADYYARASASRLVERIALPALVIYAQDDPFIVLTADTRARIEANPRITLIETRHGGHCGFLASPDGYDGRWAERLMVTFLQKINRA
ncbi:MAG TPA: alpha/beta fold hydrolase [Terriglobales bacterium]|nr:alpha/beta fold hydrolase [Terriglobales bacterium]